MLSFSALGAEETILQASHGFITQHSWAGDVAAFINLEGAGGSGRELVFQTGPRHQWLAAAYSEAAPYPFASILAQDIFQSGVIPSDTDFRIYRDHGHLPGIDVAYIDDGYIYHTELDTADQVSQGALQRCGENLAATIAALANSPYLALVHRPYIASCAAPSAAAHGDLQQLIEAHDAALARDAPSPLGVGDLRAIVAANACLDVTHTTDTGAVYFDLLGLVVVIYSVATSQKINWIALAVILVYLAKQVFKRRQRMQQQQRDHAQSSSQQQLRSQHGFPALVGLTLVSFLLSVVSSLAVGALVMLVAPMSWFSHPFLVGGQHTHTALHGQQQLQQQQQQLSHTSTAQHAQHARSGRIELDHRRFLRSKRRADTDTDTDTEPFCSLFSLSPSLFCASLCCFMRFVHHARAADLLRGAETVLLERGGTGALGRRQVAEGRCDVA